MRPLHLFAILLIANSSLAQDNRFQALLLDKKLTENADAILRLEETRIELNSVKSFKRTYRKVLTVLNKKGTENLNIYAFYDPHVSVGKIGAKIYNRLGKEIRKFKKSDFKDVSAISNFSLYEDNRVLYLDYTPVEYPFSIEFYYEASSQNTAYIPFWNPLKDYRTSTQKSVYEIVYDESVGILKKEKNFSNTIEDHSEKGHLKYVATNLQAIKAENMAPNFGNIAPELMVAPKNFYYEGYMGSNGDWKSLGKWMHDALLADRIELPESTKQTITELVDDIENPIEKAKRVYRYVQENTRYISVQEGIGGIQPIPAAEVDRSKYGDCKGLTNYTKALLDVVGIKSNYVRVYASREIPQNVDKDFPTFLGQTNHVILNIPIEGQESVWLECTSQTMPFGFLGDFTDNRDVFVITPQGGVIERTPIYADGDNKKVTKAHMKLSEEGNIAAEVEISSKGIAYDYQSAIEGLPKEKKDEHYKEYWGNINGLKIAEMNSTNDSGSVEYIERVRLEAPAYASRAGNDMLLKVNAFDANNSVPDRYRNRKQPFEVSRGFLNEDYYTIELPDAYSLSQLPEPIEITGKFGSYSANFSKNESGQLRYERKLLIKKGRYSKEEYNDYRNFRRQVAQSDNLKIVLSK